MTQVWVRLVWILLLAIFSIQLSSCKNEDEAKAVKKSPDEIRREERSWVHTDINWEDGTWREFCEGMELPLYRAYITPYIQKKYDPGASWRNKYWCMEAGHVAPIDVFTKSFLDAHPSHKNHKMISMLICYNATASVEPEPKNVKLCLYFIYDDLAKQSSHYIEPMENINHLRQIMAADNFQQRVDYQKR